MEDKQLRQHERAARIAYVLDQSSIMQQEIAEKCSITPMAVSRWKQTGCISAEHLFILSDLTGFSYAWIFTGEGEETTASANDVLLSMSDREREAFSLIGSVLDERNKNTNGSMNIRYLFNRGINVFIYLRNKNIEINRDSINELLDLLDSQEALVC